MRINPEFVKLYPDKAHLYYTNDEMKRAGMPKLAGYSDEVKRTEAIQKEKIERFKQKVIEYKQSGNPVNVGDFLKKL